MANTASTALPIAIKRHLADRPEDLAADLVVIGLLLVVCVTM